jgi:hypothetical protein
MVPTPLDIIAKPRPADPGRGFDFSPTRSEDVRRAEEPGAAVVGPTP